MVDSLVIDSLSQAFRVHGRAELRGLVLKTIDH